MKTRRVRRVAGGADAQGMTDADREAIRRYRANRGSSRYYSDLAAIDTTPVPTPKPTDKSKE